MAFLKEVMAHDREECTVEWLGHSAKVWFNPNMLTPKLMRRLRTLASTVTDEDRDAIAEIADILVNSLQDWEFYETAEDEEAHQPMPITTATIEDLPTKLLSVMLGAIIRAASADPEVKAGSVLPSSATSGTRRSTKHLRAI